MNIKNEVDIWFLNKSILVDSTHDWENIISTEEQHRANRFHFENDKRDFIVYHACKRLILSSYLKKPPKEIAISLLEKGKPFIQNETLSFNLSHTKEMAVLAVANNVEIGVDIEKIKTSANYLDIAKRFFHADEYHQLMKIENTQEQLNTFFILWTAKEAILKATGEGISAGLDNFCVQQDHSNPNELKHTYSDNIALRRLNAPDGYVATLAIVGENKSVIYREFSML